MGFLAWWILNGETCVHSWHDRHTGCQAIMNQKSSELAEDHIHAQFSVLSVRPFRETFLADSISSVNSLLTWLWIKQRIKRLIQEQLKGFLCKFILQSGTFWQYLNNPGNNDRCDGTKVHSPTPHPLVSASHTSYCDIYDEFLTAWLLTSWTLTWNKWRHKEETQGSGLGEVGCWGGKLSGCKIALQTCFSFSVCWWALNAQPLIHHHFYSFAFFGPLCSLFLRGFHLYITSMAIFPA